MSHETQDKLVKILGLAVQAAIAFVCVHFFPDNPGLLSAIMGAAGWAYGTLGFSTPIEAVQKASGLVSVRAPKMADEPALKQAIAKVESLKPPPEPPAAA